MGVADMLIKMKMTYGSHEAVGFCSTVSKMIADTAIYASASYAGEHGSYPLFDYDLVSDTPFYKTNVSEKTDNHVKYCGLANSQLLTIAPTGTLSTMLGISGGIEPIFANSYTRKTESLHGGDVYYKVYTPIVDKYMKNHGITDETKLPEWFVTSADIAPANRVLMQAAFQNGIDASISSTVNLPNSATVEDVKDIYMRAWECGLKGITVFRDGCKRTGVLTTEPKTENDSQATAPEENAPPRLKRGDIVECCDGLIGMKRKLTTGCGSLHVIGFFEPVSGELQEVYLSKGSTGGCANFMTGLSRTISLLCRAGVSIYDIKDQLDSTGACPSYATRSATKHDTSRGSCCPMAIGNALIEMYEELQEELDDTWEVVVQEAKEFVKSNVRSEPVCPECGGALRMEGGCDICPSCGYTHCG